MNSNREREEGEGLDFGLIPSRVKLSLELFYALFSCIYLIVPALCAAISSSELPLLAVFRNTCDIPPLISEHSATSYSICRDT